MKLILIQIALILLPLSLFSQQGKDGDVTISGTKIVNEYTVLTSNATNGDTSLTVASNTLNDNGYFPNSLVAGDLLLIIQMQGASINGMLHPVFGDVSDPNDITWGSIDSLQECGNWEFLEVSGTTGGSEILLDCQLQNNYTASGNVQIIRVPRYNQLSIDGTLTSKKWDGSSGGVLAIETLGNVTINGNIDVSGLGFRGGAVGSGNTYNSLWYAGTGQDKGGTKGEGVAGNSSDYDIVGGRYAKGAIGNGGGGGSANNAGGAGGANASNGTYTWTGLGIPDFTPNNWSMAWALESISTGNESSGGGRGGYAWSNNSGNPLTLAPGNTLWGGHNRLPLGGFGGRPLDYSAGKIFMGGGGGGGHENDNEGGSGGDGGGIVFVQVTGTISGSGNILADGANGEGSEGNNAGFGDIANNDGSGGAGAGGSIFLNSQNPITGISISANGGQGGNQVLDFGTGYSSDEAQGTGGGGGGGYISTSGTSSTIQVAGGSYGITNAPTMTSFLCNGATSGDVGLIETHTYTELSNCNTLSSEEFLFTNTIRVFPNPTSTDINIKFNKIQDTTIIRLLSVTGQTIIEKQYSNTSHINFDLNELNGFYFIEVINNKGNKAVFKVIKE